MEVIVSIALVAGGMWLMRKTFFIGLACTSIGLIALLAFMDLLDKAEQVPGALADGVATFIKAMGG